MNRWPSIRPRRVEQNGRRRSTNLETQAPLLRPRVTPDEPQAASSVRVRRFLQPLPLTGAALVLIALVGYWSVYSQTTDRTPVLVAARSLQAGEVLRARDLRTAELAGDAGVMASLVPERELDEVLGRTLAAPIAAGAPIPRAALARRGSEPAAFTLVVPALHALGGELKPGDRVTVMATFNDGGRTTARAIARGLEVLAVGQVSTRFDAGSVEIPVTLALPDPSLASGLALANQAGKIDLLREGSSRSASSIPSASLSEGGR